MDISRIEQRAPVGKLYLEVVAYVEGEASIRLINSTPVDEANLERFLNLKRTSKKPGANHTVEAIRAEEGPIQADWFAKYLFNGYWPENGKILNYKILQICEDGIYEVKATL